MAALGPRIGINLAELDRIDDRPLHPRRLAAIWRSLDERERWGFFLALREDLADRVLELTYKRKDGRAGDLP